MHDKVINFPPLFVFEEPKVQKNTIKKKWIPKKPRRYLTAAQVKAMTKACRLKHRLHGARNALLLKLMFRLGLRVSEATDLAWKFVDLENMIIHILRKKNGISHAYHFDKYDKGDAQLFRDLRNYRKKNLESAYVFDNSRLEKLTRQRVYEIVHSSSLWAGLEVGAHPHMLRHGCGHALAFGDVPTHTIQATLGHRSISSTQIYIAASDKQITKALKLTQI
jgi:type 1 fimbriae regulatory protein FimB